MGTIVVHLIHSGLVKSLLRTDVRCSEVPARLSTLREWLAWLSVNSMGDSHVFPDLRNLVQWAEKKELKSHCSCSSRLKHEME